MGQSLYKRSIIEKNEGKSGIKGIEIAKNCINFPLTWDMHIKNSHFIQDFINGQAYILTAFPSGQQFEQVSD